MPTILGNIIVIAVLIAVVVLAVRSLRKSHESGRQQGILAEDGKILWVIHET